MSDRASRGTYEDKSAPSIIDKLKPHTHWHISHSAFVPDEFDTIVQTLESWFDEGVNLLLTSGGTGFAPRDIIPEATKCVIEREAPGIAEAVRAASLKITQHAMLSRAGAGIRQQTLIINMPGNPKAVAENLDILLPVLPHPLDLIVDVRNSEQGHRSV